MKLVGARFSSLLKNVFDGIPMRNIDSRFKLSTYERFIAEAFCIRKLRIADPSPSFSADC